MTQYKIVKVTDKYIALHNDAGIWWMIEQNGGSGLSQRHIHGNEHDYICDSEKDAGERINLHAKYQGGETVWKS